MTDSQWQAELTKKRNQLLRVLDQGEKINSLQAAPEWNFFIEWIESGKARIIKEMSSDTFVNDHNGYLRAVGTLQALNMVIDGVAKFSKAYDNAAIALNKLNTDAEKMT